MNMSKKKSTPGGALIPKQDHSTTSGLKSHAEILFDRIGTGRGNALKRPGNTLVDRELRAIIEDANNNGDFIVNLGFGYYRPTLDELPDLQRYIKAIRSRAKKHFAKARSMEEAFNNYYGRY